MPAGLPGATPAQNSANPALGAAVTFDLISGPKGSPKDNDKDYATGTGVANANASTGQLSTGIGFGLAVGPNGTKDFQPVAVNSPTQNFIDNYTPGLSKPDATSSADSTIMYIGGGKSDAAGKTTSDPAGTSRTVPYTTGFGIGAAGNGGSRDAGAGPAFTGFTLKLVTAVADVANAAVVETGFTNRSGVTLPNGFSQFGSNTAATAAPAMAGAEDEDETRAAKEKRPLRDDEKVQPRLQPKVEPNGPQEVKALVKDLEKSAKEEEKQIKKEEAEPKKLEPKK